MEILSDIVGVISGSPQFRLTESFDENAPLYHFYSQNDLSDDLAGMDSIDSDNKQLRTFDKVNRLLADDVVFSLISGTATIVRRFHNNYLYTQNYVKLIPGNRIDPKYLVYLLNIDKSIQKQFATGLQGSQVLKYTLRQLKELEIPQLPPIGRQRIIGDIYFRQLRLNALRSRSTESETILLLKKLEEATKNE